MKKVSPAMAELLKNSGSANLEVAQAARVSLSTMLTNPLKTAVLAGDIVHDIYDTVDFTNGQGQVQFPLDILQPGAEKDFIAYAIPGLGRIPEKHVEGDSLLVHTYEVGSAIDCSAKYLREVRWDVVSRMMDVLEAAFIKKMNTDGFRVAIAAGAGRNVVVNDSRQSSGLFTKRLIELARTTMARQAGGNTNSVDRGKLTDVYLSPEALGDVRAWDLTQVDDVTRREIYVSSNDVAVKVFGVILHDLIELGVGQEFQNFYVNSLGGTFAANKTELAVGFDLNKKRSGKQSDFVMPIREEIVVSEDPTLARQRRWGAYAHGEHGFACLDNRRVLLMQL